VIRNRISSFADAATGCRPATEAEETFASAG
jgi:hypothetical protein